MAAFTCKLRSSSPGLDDPSAAEVKYGSLSCSHTNAFLVAALSQVETEQSNLSVDGRMSVAKLSQDNKLAEALQSAITWLVLSSQVRTLYPSFPDLLQHVRNAPGSVQRREGEMQLLVTMQQMAAAQSKSNGGVVQWASIGKTIARRTGGTTRICQCS